MTKLKLKYLPLSDLAAWPRNPKLHELPTILASIERFGFNDPVAVDDGFEKLLEGHGRVEALNLLHSKGAHPPKRVRVRKKDGEWLVPVITGVSFATEAEAEAYIVGHNRATESGGWLEDALAKMFTQFQDSDDDQLFDAMGYTRDDVEDIIELSAAAADAVGDQLDDDPGDEVQGEIRQVALWYQAEDYSEVVQLLQEYSRAHQLSNNTEAVLHVLGAE